MDELTGPSPLTAILPASSAKVTFSPTEAVPWKVIAPASRVTVPAWACVGTVTAMATRPAASKRIGAT